MNTAEVDLDRLVDYEREYRSVVKRAQVTGDHMIGLCPFHDDSKKQLLSRSEDRKMALL